MTMTIFPDQLFGNRGTQGQQGKAIYVKPYLGGADGQRGDAPVRSVKTLVQAQSLAKADQNDRVIMMAQGNTASHTTDYQSTTLTWAKDGVHLIGSNAGAMIGQRSRIAVKSTAVGASVAPLMSVTANNCLFENLEIFAGAPASGYSAALGCLSVSGQRNVFRNCQISGIGDDLVDVAGNYSLSLTGPENLFEDCYIGLDTISRDTATYEILMAAGAKRNLFRRCIIASYTTTQAAFTHVTASGLDRWTMFEDCAFLNMPTGISSGLTLNQSFSISGTGGNIALRRCHFMGVTKIMTTGAATLQIDPKTTELLAAVTI
jgi:hypothetical protein